MTPEEQPVTPPTGTADRLRARIHLVAACVVLVGLALVQSPGLLVPDTKLDLALAPGRFLARATHLWDPAGAFGQLQNQAYGYLWPMGPFFLLGDGVGMPGWVVQRLWVALVLVVALTGTVRLARELGVRSDLAALVAGFAYALSPRMLTTLGPISIEAWPSALAPWVLLPLVIGATRGSPRRAAASSALAVAMVGGVNAAATSAVLPLGVLWLLTRSRGPRRRSMMLWWPVFTALGTLWWLVPLAVLGSYSPPFLDFIESAANTTFPTTLADALRGTSNWVPYIDLSSRAGNDLVRQWFLVVNSAVVLLLGAAGLLHRRTPHRTFLALGVVTGLFLVTMGHLGDVQGLLAPQLHTLLDGALAPLRNVHKFDPVVRLPLVLGLAFTVQELGRRRKEVPADDRSSAAVARRINASVLVGAVTLAVVGAALPAVDQRIEPSGGFLGVPGYWDETASWLADTDGTSLLVPGSSFGQYVWGTPQDEPLQSLARSDWAVRNAIPLAPPGNIRMLDAIEARLVQGEGSAGLTTYLRRAGISHLVVRNDLARSQDVPDPVLVHQAIAGTPGLRRVATFGPVVGGDPVLTEADPDDALSGRVLVNDGWQSRYPAIEVYAVAEPRTTARTSRTLPVVVGGPEDLLDLADLGVLDAQPTELAADLSGAEPDPSAPVVLTDGLRDTERSFGRVHDAMSAVRAPGDPRTTGNRARDYLLPGASRWSTTARVDGLASLTASSSASDADAAGPVQPGELPYAAIDDDPTSAWTAGFGAGRSWWRAGFEGPRALSTVRVTAGPGERQLVRLVTDHGTTPTITLEPGVAKRISMPDPGAHWLTIQDVSGRVGTRLTIADVDIAGLVVTRSLVLPTLPDSWGDPDVIALSAARDARTGCAVVDGAARCVEGRDVASEEPTTMRRTLTLSSAAQWTPRLRASPRPGTALDDLVSEGAVAAASASSVAVRDSRASAQAAVDGELSTTWTAALDELRPRLQLRWVGQRTVSGLRLSLDDAAPARLPNEVTIAWPDGRTTADVDDTGRVRFPPLTTDQLTVQVDEADAATSIDFNSAGSTLPIGIGEIRVRGVPYFPLRASPVARLLPCGTGPTLVVDGRELPTRLAASPQELLSGETVPVFTCDDASIDLGAGTHQVDLLGSRAFDARSVILVRSGGRAGVSGSVAGDQDTDEQTATGLDADSSSRLVVQPRGRGVLDLARNTNPGWTATQDGRRLDPVVVDGWQQGWRLDQDGARVTLTFGPDRIYRAGLALGLLALLVLVALCVPARRWRRHDLEPLVEVVVPRAVPLVLTGLTGLLLAGWPGALVGLLAAGLGGLVTRRWPAAAPWVLALPVVPALGAYVVRPWGSAAGWAGDLGWPQLLVVALCGCVVATLPSRSWRRGRSRRMAGSSTSR